MRRRELSVEHGQSRPQSSCSLFRSCCQRRLRLLAGRPGSFLPDYIKTIGVPTFANRTTVFNLETLLTQKVRAEFIGRGKYQIAAARRPASTRCSPARSPAVTIAPVELQRADAARLALCDHDDRARRAARRAGEQGAVGEPEPDVPPGIRGDGSDDRRPIRRRSSARTPNASTGCAPISRARIVSAILEAF